MPRPPSIQWFYKQWLGDSKVLAMDWDAYGMHFHLLMISIQENPAGSIPDDMALIRRWLRLPSGQSDSDRTWARVQPQIFTAWTLKDSRWVNKGMVEACQRQQQYRDRYEKGTKNPPNLNAVVEEVLEVSSGSVKVKPVNEVVFSLSGNQDVDGYLVPDWIPISEWNAWIETRAHNKKPANEHAKRIAINKLAALKERGFHPVVVLEEATINSWQGIWEPKGGGNGRQNHSNAEQKRERRLADARDYLSSRGIRTAQERGDNSVGGAPSLVKKLGQ